MQTIKTYYYLAKPGIIYGNIVTTVGGFFLAARGHINLWLLLSAVGGLMLVIGSACVFNNYIDRHRDAKMDRTKKRALVRKTIPVWAALTYGTVLGVLGFALLIFGTNWQAVLVAAIGFIDYVVLYGAAKRYSPLSTLVGSIAGSTPVVVGYVAAAGRFDIAAAIVFVMQALWQMPHFYAIAMYRGRDYAAAGLPMMPAKRGVGYAKISIMVYVALFTLASTLLTALHYTGYSYLVVMLALGLGWLWVGFKGFHAPDSNKWARQMFLYSLIVIMTMSVALGMGSVLP